MTEDEFFVEVTRRVFASDDDLRVGQTMFNLLQEMNPELADAIRGTPFDPFYDDGKIALFLTHFRFPL